MAKNGNVTDSAEQAITPSDSSQGRLRVEERLISSLKPYARNARTHSKKQIQQIASSIREFGFTSPVLIDRNDTIIAGHGRVAAAKLLGHDQVPTIKLEHLNEAQRRAYILADNKLAENAGWDTDILAIELQHLAGLELDFDLETIGFETAEIDILVDGASKTKKNNADDLIPRHRVKTVVHPGDIWTLGEHRLVCGDARDPDLYRVLMEEPARVVFADPPYNVAIDGHVGGRGSIKHPEFAMACGEMTPEQFVAFLGTVFRNAANASHDGAIHYLCIDWRHVEEMLRAAKPVYSELKNICVWNKGSGGMGSFYRSQHEFVFVFKVGSAAHVNTIELGRSGRYRTNVWDYGGLNVGRAGRLEELALHPTVKPTALIVDAIKDCSKRGDIVLDPFGGSGTTIIAAEKTKRRARVIEIDPGYCDVTIRRWQQRTGKSAVHAASGRIFSDEGGGADQDDQTPDAKVRS